MNELTGKLALVTGGSRGIGAASAIALAVAGADVAITYQSAAEDAARVVKQIEAVGRRGFAFQADAADAAAVEKVVGRRLMRLVGSMCWSTTPASGPAG